MSLWRRGTPWFGQLLIGRPIYLHLWTCVCTHWCSETPEASAAAASGFCVSVIVPSVLTEFREEVWMLCENGMSSLTCMPTYIHVNSPISLCYPACASHDGTGSTLLQLWADEAGKTVDGCSERHQQPKHSPQVQLRHCSELRWSLCRHPAVNQRDHAPNIAESMT